MYKFLTFEAHVDRRIPDSQSKIETALVLKPYRMQFITNYLV